MKSLVSLAFALLIVGGVYAQSTPSWRKTIGMSYGFTLPTGSMKPYIRNGNGLMMNLLFEAPSRRIATGFEFNYTGYGHSKSKQEYTFPDGTSAPMNIVVDNSIISLMAVSRLYFILEGPVRPYASVKAGYTFFNTSLSIVDPNDWDSCEPVDSDILSKDGTLAYSAGGGLTIDAALLFKKMQKGKMLIDISSNITQGGKVTYMNEDAPDVSSNHNTTRGKEVNADFINTQTQVVHQHHVGYLYNSFVQMMDFRLGVSFNTSW